MQPADEIMPEQPVDESRQVAYAPHAASTEQDKPQKLQDSSGHLRRVKSPNRLRRADFGGMHPLFREGGHGLNESEKLFDHCNGKAAGEVVVQEKHYRTSRKM